MILFRGEFSFSECLFLTIQDVEKHYNGYPKDRLNCLHNLLGKIIAFIRDQDENKSYAMYWQSGDNDIKVFEVVDPDRFAVQDELKNFIRDN